MIDATLLRVLSTRQGYDRYRKAVPMATLDERTQVVIKDFDAWYQETEAADARGQEFATFFGVRHPKLDADQVAVYLSMIRAARTPVDETVEASLLSRLAAHAAAHQMTTLLEKWNSGEEVDLFASMSNTMTAFESSRGVIARDTFIEEDGLESWLTREMDESGLHWGLRCIERNWRPLRGGDFGVIGARVGVGKTTLITQLEAAWAAQLPPDRCVLHLNNEGPGDRIMQRVIQSALRATIPEMVQLGASKVLEKYRQCVGGANRVKVQDIHGQSTIQVEELIRKYNPGIVVVDMMEHVRLGSESTHGGTRTDQMLEAVAQLLRIFAVKYDIPIIGTVQLSGDAQGVPYPTLAMVKDSKTGIQAALDFFLTVGMSDDTMLENSRFIGGCKSKINRPGGKTSPHTEVTIVADRGFYKEAEDADV